MCVCVRKPLINPFSTIHEATSFRAEYFEDILCVSKSGIIIIVVV